NPVESEAGLVNGSFGEDVSFRNGCVASVVGDFLGAGKSARRGKTGRTAGHKRGCLVVAEAGESRVLAPKIVIQPNVELAFVEPPYGDVGEIEAQRWFIGIGLGIQLHQSRAHGIKHTGRDQVAGRPTDLRAVGSRGYRHTAVTRKRRETRAIRIGEVAESVGIERPIERAGTWNPERIHAEIAVYHSLGRNQTDEWDAVALHLGFVVDKEKCFVFLDRSTQRAAELVEVELLFDGGEIAGRIQLGVAEKFEQRAVP